MTFVSRQYTIMNAGSITGAFNPAIVNAGLPAAFSTALSYDPTHAYLNVTLNFVPPAAGGNAAPAGGNAAPGFGTMNLNQQNVANTLVNTFNATGNIPMAFGMLTPAGLTQVSGEGATASQQTTFDAMGQFLGLLTDPFMDAGNGFSGAASPAGYGGRSPMPTRTAATPTKPSRCSPRRRRKPSSSAGACGQQAMAVRSRPAGTRSWARTIRSAGSPARRSARIICSHLTRWRALRWPVEAPASA